MYVHSLIFKFKGYALQCAKMLENQSIPRKNTHL